MLDPKLAQISRTLRSSTFPKKLAMELCAECNFACSMCHHPSMRRAKGVLPFELWYRCADETAAVAPDTEVWFSFCGEPLLEPDRLIEYLHYGTKAGLRSLNVNSNGQLLTRALAAPLLETGVDVIVFGLDALTAPVYSRIRVNGDRDSVLAGNWRVAVLVDGGTVSAAEVLVLHALRSTRAVVIGEPTAGALDYQSVQILSLGTGDTRWGLGIAPQIAVSWDAIPDPIAAVEQRLPP